MKSLNSFMDTSKSLYAFIAQSGNFGYDFKDKNTSSHFIVTAVITEEANLRALEKNLQNIKENFFLSGDFILSPTLKEPELQAELSKEIFLLDFKIFSVVADKKKIFSSNGLMDEKSFIKFLNGLLYDELHNYFPKLQIIASNSEDEDFSREFKKYILKNHIPNLFGEYDFGLSPIESEICLQLADFLCRIISSDYEENLILEDYKIYSTSLRNKLLPVVFWPQQLTDQVKRLEEYKKGTYDENIAYSSIQLANRFIDKNKNSNLGEIQEQVYILRYLLSMVISQRSDNYISSREILDNLREIFGREYSPHYFKTRIIAKIRDAGVLISSSQNGYKIPIREKEILAFVNQTSSMIKPMLERLNICRNRVLSATDNKFDVLDFKEYEYLKRFFEDI